MALPLIEVMPFVLFGEILFLKKNTQKGNHCESFTNYIEKLGVLGMKKENLAEVLWKALVMGEITNDENKKKEVSNIELQIMNKKNDC